MISQLLQKILGSYLEKKAELYEGTPEDGKPWYRSKVILGGIVVIARSLYLGISTLLVQSGKAPLPAIPPVVDSVLGSILGAVVIHGRIDANKPITVAPPQ